MSNNHLEDPLFDPEYWGWDADDIPSPYAEVLDMEEAGTSRGYGKVSVSKDVPAAPKPHNPVIWMTADCKRKVDLYIQNCKDEISMLGLVEQEEGNVFIVTDVFLVDQECSPSETEMDRGAVADLMVELDSQGIDIGKLKAWIHSHAKMKVFWSGTDDTNINEWPGDDYLVSIVGNHAGDYLARLDLYSPIRVAFDKLPFEIIPEAIPEEEVQAIVDEIKQKVRTKTYSYTSKNRHHGSGGYINSRGVWVPYGTTQNTGKTGGGVSGGKSAHKKTGATDAKSATHSPGPIIIRHKEASKT